MRILLVLSFTLLSLFADEIPQRCSSSINCKSCHGHIVKDWERSWHAKSHVDKNEYYRKSLEFVAKRRYKGVNRVKFECAVCHNPRISLKKVSEFADIDYAFNTRNKDSELVKAVEQEALKEGINCIVCHKIDSIDDSQSKFKRGNTILTWLETGTIGGPFADSKSNFHKSKQQKFFNNPDKLCLVCHDNMRGYKDFIIADTGDEFRANKREEKCVDCHMSKKVKGYAALVKNAEGKKVKRLIRRHKFAGAHSEGMIKGALDVKLKADQNFLYVTITNPNPHSVPTGFGGRAIIIEVKSKIGGRENLQKKVLTTHYKSKRGRPTIPHMAVTQKSDVEFEPYKARTFKFKRIKMSQEAVVRVSFQLVNDEIAEILDLKEKRWRQKRLIQEVKARY